MKKKFLSLMMAAAVVATTSVSAFAANTDANTTDLTGPESSELTTEINITGDVEDKDGAIKPGTLSVTVPTTASFRVNRTGGFTGADLTVVNKGSKSIEVYVQKFVDVNGDDGIKVVSETETGKAAEVGDAVTRDKVSLKVVGNAGVAYLGTKAVGATGSGVYSDKGLTQVSEVKEKDGQKVSEIAAGKSYTMKLEGEAGKKTSTINTAIKDTFTLRLAIRKKADNKPSSETSSDISSGTQREDN